MDPVHERGSAVFGRHLILAVLDQGEAYLDQLAAVCEHIVPGLTALGAASATAP